MCCWWVQLFPYHLCEYVCRVMRLSPFRYYVGILADTMREDMPYDSIPNFTVRRRVAGRRAGGGSFFGWGLPWPAK